MIRKGAKTQQKLHPRPPRREKEKEVECQSNRVRIPGNDWSKCPILTTVPRLRFSPFFAPLNWSQASGLVGVIMEARNILGPGNEFKLVELGTCNGESASMFLGSGMFDKVWLFDYWTNERSEGLCEYNMRRYEDKAFMVYGDVNEMVKAWEIKIDMIYIDAGHQYKDVQQNLEDWDQHVRTGGVFSGHDYSKSWEGVKRAVDEFAKAHGCKIKTFEDSSWLIEKTW